MIEVAAFQMRDTLKTDPFLLTHSSMVAGQRSASSPSSIGVRHKVLTYCRFICQMLDSCWGQLWCSNYTVAHASQLVHLLVHRTEARLQSALQLRYC